MFLLNKLLGISEVTSNTTSDKIKIPRNNLYFLNGGCVSNEVINMLKDKPDTVSIYILNVQTSQLAMPSPEYPYLAL